MSYTRLQRLLTLEPLELRTAADGRSLGPEHRLFIDGLQAHIAGRTSMSAKREYAPAAFHQHSITGGINTFRQSNALAPIYHHDAATNVITLDIQGPLALHASLFEMECSGVCSYDHLNAALQEIPLVHPDASAVVININSPGGQLRGSQATSQFVLELAQTMPVIAYSDDLMCSAAMKIAAGATQILTSSDAEVGSIGTIIAWLDNSEYLEKLGMRWEVIASAELKGMGYGSLSEVQRTYLQETVDSSAASFKNWMLQNRPEIPEDAMRGQSFQASRAPTGLIDSYDFPTLAYAQAYAATLRT